MFTIPGSLGSFWPTHLFLWVSLVTSNYIYAYLYIYLYIYIYVKYYANRYIYIYISIYPSIYLSISLSLSIYLSIFLSISIDVCVCPWKPVSLSHQRAMHTNTVTHLILSYLSYLRSFLANQRILVSIAFPDAGLSLCLWIGRRVSLSLTRIKSTRLCVMAWETGI